MDIKEYGGLDRTEAESACRLTDFCGSSRVIEKLGEWEIKQVRIGCMLVEDHLEVFAELLPSL